MKNVLKGLSIAQILLTSAFSYATDQVSQISSEYITLLKTHEHVPEIDIIQWIWFCPFCVNAIIYRVQNEKKNIVSQNVWQENEAMNQLQAIFCTSAIESFKNQKPFVDISYISKKMTVFNFVFKKNWPQTSKT